MATRRGVPGPRAVQRILNEYLAGGPDLREAEAQIGLIRRACEKNVQTAQAALERMTISGSADDETLGVLLELLSRPQRQALQAAKDTLTTVEHALTRVRQARGDRER